jgi:prolyl-tRNA synthetase
MLVAVAGCYILRPWAFAMWEVVQRWFDDNIKGMGVQNAYFPMFITEDVLNTEKDHVEGFAPEVGSAVTGDGLEGGGAV